MLDCLPVNKMPIAYFMVNSSLHRGKRKDLSILTMPHQFLVAQMLHNVMCILLLGPIKEELVSFCIDIAVAIISQSITIP